MGMFLLCCDRSAPCRIAAQFLRFPFKPAATLATRSEWPSISGHLVGEREELWWNFETERLGGIELIASSNLVGCMIGMSAGLVPFKMLPV